MEDALSPFKKYEFGIAHEGELYPSPMHLLLVLLHGASRYRDMMILDVHTPELIAQVVFNFSGSPNDVQFCNAYRPYFPYTPFDAGAYAARVARMVKEQSGAPFFGIKGTLPRMCGACGSLRVFCEAFRKELLK